MRWLKGCAVFILILVLAACQRDHHTAAGYIEGDFTYMSSSQPGSLIALYVHRGQWVKAGQTLFEVNPDFPQTQLDAALAAEQQAQANVQDLLTGSRQPKLDEIAAQIAQAEAQLVYARKQEQRNQHLVATYSVQQQALDLARQNARVALAQVQQYEHALAFAKLPARPKQIVAAEAALKQAKAELSGAQWRVGQTKVRAPARAQVFDNFYWVGEQVPAQHAVLSLLVPGNVRVLFYIPEPMLSQLHVGQAITFTTDGSQQIGKATISYIAPHAEYTPPVIYSRESQSKLVYRVEARFASVNEAKQWYPGQPVTVQLPESV